jgi:hypothetical protein
MMALARIEEWRAAGSGALEMREEHGIVSARLRQGFGEAGRADRL